jgi:DNA mismatch endonuclease, patch repair protein
MQAVRSKDTAPELLVRRLLHSHGYRYRLHNRALPGCPDLIFSSRRKVIFVNGCFWHGHDCARGSRVPKTNRGYWTAKVDRNRARDATATRELENAGWDALVLWECELRDKRLLLQRLRRFLK